MKPDSILRLRTWLGLGLGLLSAIASAQGSAELITDRPDQTESAAVVPEGSWQLEAGWTFASDDEDGVETEVWELPGTLLRYGIAPRLELRLGWSGWIDQEVDDGSRRRRVDGAGDAEVGVKLLLRDGRGRAPNLALLASTSLPTAGDGLGSDHADPSLALLASHSLAEGVDLGYNLGARRVSEAGGDQVEGFYTLALGRSLGPSSGVFVEIFGDLPEEGDGGVSIDGGFTWQVTPRFQIDLFAGAGLDDAADDFFAGMGFSLRWPR